MNCCNSPTFPAATSVKAARALLFALATLLLTCGCASVLPRSHNVKRSQWRSYEEAQAAFEKVTPLQTRVAELRVLGFDPAAPNVRVLTYLDVIERFMPNQSITKEDLDKTVRECIEVRDGCRALELELGDIKGNRIGNPLLDIFGFRRKTHETGWRFKALLLIRDDLVVYKLSSGEPTVDRLEQKVKPLGPLQELDSVLVKSIPGI